MFISTSVMSHGSPDPLGIYLIDITIRGIHRRALYSGDKFEKRALSNSADPNCRKASIIWQTHLAVLMIAIGTHGGFLTEERKVSDESRHY